MPANLCSVISKPTKATTKRLSVQLRKEKVVPVKRSRKTNKQSPTRALQVTINNTDAGAQPTPVGVVSSAPPSGVLQTQTTWSPNPGPALATSLFLQPQPQFTSALTSQTWAPSWNPQTGSYALVQQFPQVPWMSRDDGYKLATNATSTMYRTTFISPHSGAQHPAGVAHTPTIAADSTRVTSAQCCASNIVFAATTAFAASEYHWQPIISASQPFSAGHNSTG